MFQALRKPSPSKRSKSLCSNTVLSLSSTTSTASKEIKVLILRVAAAVDVNNNLSRHNLTASSSLKQLRWLKLSLLKTKSSPSKVDS